VTLHDGTPRYAPQRRGEELLVFYFYGDEDIGPRTLEESIDALQPLGLLQDYRESSSLGLLVAHDAPRVLRN
jgi:hypothetical protein